ncbi:hypothetical protein C8J57DRAFT_1271533 [Mycena rebaudengoi]|nr:hypothetical protein C8J57DRAFT_1271533 [Mycena rebaudengoi]
MSIASQSMTPYRLPPRPSVPGQFFQLETEIWLRLMHLQPFLCSPDDSPLCAFIVSSLLNDMGSIPLLADPTMRKAFLRILRTTHRDFLDVLMRVIAIPKTSAQLETFQNRLSRCRCASGQLRLPLNMPPHSHPSISKSSFDILIVTIFKFLAGIFQRGFKPRQAVRAQISLSGGEPTPRKWPSDTVELFPNGEEAAVMAFASWYHLTKAIEIIEFLHDILDHSPSLRVPVTNCEPLWVALVDQLGCAVEQFHAQPLTSESAFSLDSGTPQFAIYSIAQFVGRFDQSVVASSLIKSHSKNIYHLLLKPFLRVQNISNQESDHLVLFTGHLAGAIGNVVVDSPLHPALRSHLFGTFSQADLKKSNWDVIAAANIISYVLDPINSLRATRCCNTLCAVTRASGAIKLLNCSGCNTMSYCSKDCQRSAWKSHKVFCKDLTSLREKQEAMKLGFTVDRFKSIEQELRRVFPIPDGFTL